MDTAEVGSELTKLQFFTMSTCGEACWEAREDVCRCSCGGKNHGILKSGKRPERTCKMGAFWYKLHEVAAYADAQAHCLELRRQDCAEHPEKYLTAAYPDHPMVYYSSQAGDAYHCKAASKAQKNWQEVIDADVQGYIYLVWKRIPAPTEAA